MLLQNKEGGKERSGKPSISDGKKDLRQKDTRFHLIFRNDPSSLDKQGGVFMPPLRF